MSTASILELPNELIELIFAKLAIRDVFRTQRTCKKWKTLIWSSQVDIIFPYYSTQRQRRESVCSAIHSILTSVNPVKIQKLDLSTPDYILNEQDIAGLKKMKVLRHLTIDFHDMTQESCSFISCLVNLQHLALNTKPIQECIDSVGSAALPHLTSLAIIALPLYDVLPLRNLTRLRALDLRFCKLLRDDYVSDVFTSLTQLDTLDISRVMDMTSIAFESISCLTNLTDLSMSFLPYPNTKDETIILNKVLSSLSKLKSLDMNSVVCYNNETIKIISNMSDLTRLAIYFEIFRPAEALSKLTNMQHLHLSYASDKRRPDTFYTVMTNLTSLTLRMSVSEFSNLQHLTQLKCFVMNGKDQIDSSIYPYLQQMTRLEQLDFQYSTFTAMQLGCLSSLLFLTSLNVRNISYLKRDTNDVISSLTQLTNLRTLYTLSDWSTSWLLKFPYLESLEVQLPRNISVDLDGPTTLLTPLLSITKLYNLRVDYTPCSAEKVGELFHEQRNLTSLCVNGLFI